MWGAINWIFMETYILYLNQHDIIRNCKTQNKTN